MTPPLQGTVLGNALQALGVRDGDFLGFAAGDAVEFSFQLPQGGDVVGWVQAKPLLLVAQLFFIKDSRPGLPRMAFRTFIQGVKAISHTLGVREVELQGGNVRHPGMRLALQKRGFRIKHVPTPPLMGGYPQEVFFRVDTIP